MHHQAFVFLVEGFEEIEAVTIVDILRRGHIEVSTVSLTGSEVVTGSHNIQIKADLQFEAFSAQPGDMLILPGGSGTKNYNQYPAFLALLKKHNDAGEQIAAICAAPGVLGALHILNGKTAVCYPSHEPELLGATIGGNIVETDGNIITSKGPGTTMFFALEIVRTLMGEQTAESVAQGLLLHLL